MAKIVPFKKPEPKIKDTEKKVNVVELSGLSLDTMLDKVMALDLEIEPTVYFLKIENHVHSLAGFIYKREDIELRRQGLKSLSKNNIFKEIVKSNKNDWSKHPSYYLALIKEWESRK